jgi:hypothetical protein
MKNTIEEQVMLGEASNQALFFFPSLRLPILLYYYAMALGEVVAPAEGGEEGLSNRSDIILYISNS